MENLMTSLSRRTVLVLTIPALFLALVPNCRGHGCCGGMSPAMLQYMQLQLMQQQYSLLQQPTSPAANLQMAINQFATQSDSSLREALKDDDVLTRLSAAYVAGEKRRPLQADLIALLTDKNDTLRQVARLSLIKLSMTAPPLKTAKKGAQPAGQGMDFGPLPNANRAAQAKAARQWREWWDKRE
jgi:hypothetical protein